MKSTSLVFSVIAWAALMSGSSYGLSSTAQSDQPTSAVDANQSSERSLDAPKAAALGDERGKRSQQPAEERQTIRDTVRSPGEGHKNLSGTTHGVPRSRAQSNSTSGVATAPHRAAPVQFPGSRGASIAQTSAVNRTVAMRPSNAIRPLSQLLGPAHHRSINPPAIGGTVSVSHASNGTINGASVHRKP